MRKNKTMRINFLKFLLLLTLISCTEDIDFNKNNEKEQEKIFLKNGILSFSNLSFLKKNS